MACAPTIFYIAPVSMPSVKYGTHYYGDTNHNFYPGGVDQFVERNGAAGYKFFPDAKSRGIEAAKMTKNGYIFRHKCK